MENKQTAVEFIKLKLEQYGDPQYCEITWVELDEIIEQAKQMEKEQLKQAYWRGVIDLGNDNVGFEQYYKEINGKD